jgi:membrane protein DedA with SNARE-associated domain
LDGFSLEQFFFYLKNMHPVWAYSFLFVSALIENIFPPIPGDTVTIIGAYLVGVGALQFWGVFLSTTLGSITGFMGLYAFAFWLERKIIERYLSSWVTRVHIDKVEGWFHHYGYWIILFNRFLSGVRSVISLVAGITKMHPFGVFLLGIISCAIWNGGLIYLGASLGKNWQDIIAFLSSYNKTVIILLATVLIIYLFFRFAKSRIQRKSASTD